MMRIFFAATIVVCSCLRIASIQAADFSWNTVVANANWNSASSWSPAGGPPTALDNAILGPLASAYTATLSNNQSITNLTLNSSNTTLSHTGGNLTASGTIAINNGAYNLIGGTLTLNGNLTTANSGSLNWTGGALAGTGTLAGTVTVPGGGSVTGTTLSNAGTINWQAGTILAAGTTAVFSNSGMIDFRADGIAFGTSAGGNGTLVNSGTLRKSAGAITNTEISWAVTLNNGGGLDAQTGLLRFNNGGTLGNGTTTVTGAGTVALTGGVFTVPSNATFTANSVSGATLNLAGATLTAGSLGGTLAGTVTVTAGGAVTGSTLTNAGTINWQAGVIVAPATTSFLTNSGTIDFRADGIAFGTQSGGNGTIINTGMLRKSGGSVTSSDVYWAVDFRNGGQVQTNLGALSFFSGGTLNNGTTLFSSSGGSGGAYLVSGVFTIPNNATFTAGSVSGTTLNLAGATLTAGSLGGTLAGTVTVTGGGAVTGTTLTNAGTINWQAGAILAPATTSVLTNSGLIDLKADGVAFGTQSGGNGTLINTGTLRKSGGTTGNTNVSWAVQNSGLIDAQVGTLLLSVGTVTNSGTINAGSGATVNAVIVSNDLGVVRGAASGTGNYTGNQTFNSGSTLAAGGLTNPGRLILNGNLVMNNESMLHLNLNGNTVTTGFDRVLVNGSVTLNNTTLDGATGGSFNPTASQNFFILVNDDTDAITGTFSGLPNGATGTLGNYNFNISYFGNFDTGLLTGGNDVVLYNFTPVPEPTTILALSASVLGVVQFLRRRNGLGRNA